MYYTIVLPKEYKPYIKECQEYVSVSGMCDTSAGFYGITHPEHRLRALLDCTVIELLEKKPTTVYIYSSEPDINRDMYCGLDKKTADYILSQIV